MKIKPVTVPPNTYNKQILKRFFKHKLAVISLVFLCVIILLAVLAPAIAPYDPNRTTGGFSKAPDAAHWLGTDQVGRDVLSRLLYGTRISLTVGFLATLISTVIGVVLGLIAGYFGGWIDMVIMRFTDMVMPNIISFGFLNTFTKCSIFKVVPIPKRMIPKRMFMMFIPINPSKTQLKELGIIIEIATAIRMIIKKYFSISLNSLFMG